MMLSNLFNALFGTNSMLAVMVSGLASGAVIGGAQYLLLRGWLVKAGWWVLATGLGFGVAFSQLPIVGLFLQHTPLSEALQAFLIYPFAGLLIALTQWFYIVRRTSRSPWWILASVLGWAVGYLLTTLSSYLSNTYLAFFAAIAVVYGLFTGLTLLWFGVLDRPVLPKPAQNR